MPTGLRGKGESSSAPSQRVSETIDIPNTRAPTMEYAI